MLKIAYPVCCGIDVHKTFIVACVATTNQQGVTTYKSKRFSTFTKELRRCATKTTRISRAGAYIKPLLVQCALNAV